MGANTKQGWYLLIFIAGFTFLVAGLAYLGAFIALVGLVGLVVSLIGFYQIKPLEHASAPRNQAPKHGV
jgi:membrane-bound ClpP family serine protease